MKNWGECYFDHFTDFFGDPIDQKIFRQSAKEPSIQVLSYENVFPRCRVFCTLGLTHYKAIIKETAEVYLPVDKAWEIMPSLLCNSLFYIVQQRMAFGWGIAISGIEVTNPEFTHRYDKTALYFTLPFGLPSDFNKVTCNDEAGRMYLAFFISQAEQDFFSKHGAQKFQAHLESKKVDPYDLSRPSCC